MTDHLNSIQRMCTNLESDAELVVGEIYGMRQWSLKYDPFSERCRLVGHQTKPWNVEGENLASCDIGFRPVTQHVYFDASTWESGSAQRVFQFCVERMFSQNPAVDKIKIDVWKGPSLPVMTVYRHEEAPNLPWKVEADGSSFRIGNLGKEGALIGPHLTLRLHGLEPVPAHEVTDPSCTCGFYAYTSEDSLKANSRNDMPSSIFGIVKAYGHVTEGTRGFRAQKAKIVGLTVPLSYTMSVQLNVPGPTPVFVSDGTDRVPQLYNNGGLIPAFSWQPSAYYNRDFVEMGAIPNTVPRFKSFDEMLSTYRKLSGTSEPEAWRDTTKFPSAYLKKMMDPGPRPTPDFIRDLLNLNPDPRKP